MARESGPVSITREHEVAAAFVELAGSLVTGYEVVDLFTTLAERCTQLIDVAAVGLLLADPHGSLHVVAASSNDLLHLETFQVQQAEGPCLDCHGTGEPVSVADLDTTQDRWPRFVRAAHLAGFRSVHALPLRLGTTTIGAMGLFGTSRGSLAARDLQLGQALADVASIALVQQRAAADRSVVIEQLQHALDSRVAIEQAKGVIAQSGGVSMDEAFAVLRRHSRDHNLTLTDLARRVASRQLAATEVLTNHAGSLRRG